jgi:hypothetical protein
LPEYVTIIRPYHPFEGNKLAVFGQRRYQGKSHLILTLPDGSRSLMPVEWTDLDSFKQDSLAAPKQNTHLGSLTDLLHARAVVDALLKRAASRANDEKSADEENNDLAAHSEFLRHPHSRIPSLGNAGERANQANDRRSGATDQQSHLRQSDTGGRS